MPRKAQPWFRFYVETPGDPKVRRIPFDRRWLWAAVMSAAKESPVPGWLYIAENVPMTFQELADYAGAPLRVTISTLELMHELRMIETIGGVVHLINWDVRQYESDNVTARTRAHRERSKERSNDVPKNVPGTAVGTPQRQRTETETDTSVVVALEGQRNETLRATPATTPPRCTAHQRLPPDTDPGPCRGCKTIREHHDRLAKARAAEAKALRDNCETCHGDGWIPGPNGTPAAKCRHQPIDVVGGGSPFEKASTP